MADFPPALRHGELTEILPDVFFVTGAMKMAGPVSFSRNMTVIRQGDELTVINSMRLDEQGLASLDRLGKVRHVLRIAGFHGRDDAFFKDRYGAQVACVAGQVYSRGFGKPKPEDIYFRADVELDPGKLPIEGARLHVIRSKPPEAVVVWERHGGTLITGDSLQNWAQADPYFSVVGKLMMKAMGFIKPTNVGPGWLKQARPSGDDLGALQQLSFANVLPAHGAPVLGAAKEKFGPAIERAIGKLGRAAPSA